MQSNPSHFMDGETEAQKCHIGAGKLRQFLTPCAGSGVGRTIDMDLEPEYQFSHVLCSGKLLSLARLPLCMEEFIEMLSEVTCSLEGLRSSLLDCAASCTCNNYVQKLCLKLGKQWTMHLPAQIFTPSPPPMLLNSYEK